MSRYADHLRRQAEETARKAVEQKQALEHGVIPRDMVVAAPLQEVVGQATGKLSQLTGGTVITFLQHPTGQTVVCAAQPNGQPSPLVEIQRTVLHSLLMMLPKPDAAPKQPPIVLPQPGGSQ